MDAANALGGKDNVSAIVMDIVEAPRSLGKLRKTLDWILKH